MLAESARALKSVFCMFPCVQATLRFLKKKGVIPENHVVREPQPLEEGSTVSTMSMFMDITHNTLPLFTIVS